MPEQRERPRPQGDPLEKAADTNREENRSQRQSDAPPDAAVGREIATPSDRSEGRGSDANGIPEFDETGGDLRRKQYDDGAEIVSGTD